MILKEGQCLRDVSISELFSNVRSPICIIPKSLNEGMKLIKNEVIKDDGFDVEFYKIHNKEDQILLRNWMLGICHDTVMNWRKEMGLD